MLQGLAAYAGRRYIAESTSFIANPCADSVSHFSCPGIVSKVRIAECCRFPCGGRRTGLGSLGDCGNRTSTSRDYARREIENGTGDRRSISIYAASYVLLADVILWRIYLDTVSLVESCCVVGLVVRAGRQIAYRRTPAVATVY